MNKVIGEFLSNQQPYPQFMATVVYKVSSRLIPTQMIRFISVCLLSKGK